MEFDKLKFKEQLEKEQKELQELQAESQTAIEERYKIQAESSAIITNYFNNLQWLFKSPPKTISIFPFELIQYRDLFKNKWCKENKIPLIRIPYTHLNKITIKDLKLESSIFLMEG